MTVDTIQADRSIASIVRETPAAASVFESFGIDYCCGGDQPLAEACAEESIDVSTVRERLAELHEDEDGTHDDWETPSELVEYIVETHHEPLREELPEMESLVDTVSRVHGENHPELHELAELFPDLAEELRTHTAEEEEEGFPLIKKLDRGESLTDEEFETLTEEIEQFEDDHEETAEMLERIEALTNGYEVHDDACPSYRAMLARLEELEQDTHMHVHRENNILFPMAEERLASTDENS
jgi:regulator of cell morphogenesis and NO signaling